METGIGGQLRSVVSLIDRLRDIQLEKYIQLPKIVVVGSQSSGKSSLIEQIVGLDFLPRGTGVVTRRPLEIRMTYDQKASQPIASFEQIPGKTFNDFLQVKAAIDDLTDKICGKSKNIVDKAIILKVQSNSCPNLTVIDLPGLTRIALEGQDKEIYKITKDMINKYMADLSSIILCVVPANQDITNDEVLYMAMNIDKLGQRTIACITKIDIMDRGTDSRALLLNKGEVPLKLGYIGIKNRSQADIQQGLTVADSLKNEKMFFSTSPIYSSLPASCLGTSALVNSLTKVLQSNITQFLPQLLEQIKQRKSSLHQIIKQFGQPLPKGQAQQQALLWCLSSQFLNQFKKSLRGHLTSLKGKEQISKTSAHLNHTLEATLQDELNALPQGVTSQRVYLAIIKFQAGSLPGFPSIHSFYYLIDPIIKRLKLPLVHTLAEVCETVIRLAQTILQEMCKDFEGFRDYLKERVNRLIDEARLKCSTFIDQMIQCQMNYIYTNNEEFYTLLEHPPKQKQSEDPFATKHPHVIILKQRVLAYYKIITKNLRDLIPRNIKRTVLELAMRSIEFQIFQANHNNPEKVKEWLKPTVGNYEDRVKKEKEYQVLLKAEQFLLTHPAFSRVRVEDVKRRRAERERQLKEIQQKQAKEIQQKQAKNNQKIVEESPIRKEEKPGAPKDSAHKPHLESLKTKETEKTETSQELKADKGGMFQNVFGMKKQEQKKGQKVSEAKTTPPNQKKDPKKGDKGGIFDNLFGGGGKREQPKEHLKRQQPPPTPSYKDQYNKKAGQAADKTVDQVFKNQTFQKQSKKAVESGTSTAMQQQLGVSQKTGNTLGKGAAWLFGQQATQNVLKDQAKINLKNQTQMKK